MPLVLLKGTEQDSPSQVMGSLADKKCVQGQRVSGILVKKNFNYHILNPSDLSSKYFEVLQTVPSYIFVLLLQGA